MALCLEVLLKIIKQQREKTLKYNKQAQQLAYRFNLLSYKEILVSICWYRFLRRGYGKYICKSAAAAAKLLQSCPTLCDPIDGSPPGSPVPGIHQARTLEWVDISFSNAWKGKVKVKSLSLVRLFATPWSAAYQAPLSMGFSRLEYWSGVPLPSPFVRVKSIK